MNGLEMWKYLFLPLVFYGWSDLHNVKSLEEFQSIVHYFRTSFPCEECRNDFDNMVENHVYPVEKVRDLSDARIWSWLTHNMVNRKIGKKWKSLKVLKNEWADL